MNTNDVLTKLIAEIERLKQDNETSDDKEYAQYEIDVACGYAMACEEILSIIASLQQEKPEVELEKAARYVYESWMGGTMDDVRRDMVELGKVLKKRGIEYE